MFRYKEYIRKPDFTAIETIDYNEYWRRRGTKLKDKLLSRERIMYDMIPEGSTVIDIGCGNSLLPVKLHEKGCTVTCADISTLILKEFERHNIQTIELNLESLCESSESLLGAYDYVILSEVLEHTSRPESIMTRLKPHTHNFIITIPNSAYYLFRYGLMFRGRFFTQWVYHPSEHLRFWSHLDFMDWIAALGLTCVAFRASNGVKILNNIWLNMFGFQIVYLCKSV